MKTFENPVWQGLLIQPNARVMFWVPEKYLFGTLKVFSQQQQLASCLFDYKMYVRLLIILLLFLIEIHDSTVNVWDTNTNLHSRIPSKQTVLDRPGNRERHPCQGGICGHGWLKPCHLVHQQPRSHWVPHFGHQREQAVLGCYKHWHGGSSLS